MKNKLNLFLSAVLFLFTTSLSATPLQTISFLDGNQGIAESFWFESAGISLTVSAWTTSVNEQQNQLEPWQLLFGESGVYNGSSGLGVVSGEHDGLDLDGGSSGNYANDADEGLLFVFSEQVNLLAFTAGDLSANDDLNFSRVSLTSADSLDSKNLFTDRNTGNDSYALSSDAFGYAFMVWVDGNNDDVRIENITFSVVPEPSALLMLSLGLLICGYRKRMATGIR